MAAPTVGTPAIGAGYLPARHVTNPRGYDGKQGSPRHRDMRVGTPGLIEPMRATLRSLMAVTCLMMGLGAIPVGPAAKAAPPAEGDFGCCRPAPVRFAQPSGIATDAQGDVYVADVAKGRVVELAAGRLVRQWTSRLGSPLGIAVDQQGNLYVTAQDSPVITKLSPAGRVLARWGRPGKDLVTFSFPHAVAVDAAGNLYVSDWGNNRIVKIDAQGRPAGDWAMKGTSPGALWHPLGITVDAHGHVYVTDAGGYRVQEFSSDGQLLGAWYTRALPRQAAALGSLEVNSNYGYQSGVAVDAAGNIYVTNWRDSSVRELSQAGKVLAHWTAEKGNRFQEPSGIAVGAGGTVYVADWGTGRLFTITSHVERFIPRQ